MLPFVDDRGYVAAVPAESRLRIHQFVLRRRTGQDPDAIAVTSPRRPRWSVDLVYGTVDMKRCSALCDDFTRDGIAIIIRDLRVDGQGLVAVMVVERPTTKVVGRLDDGDCVRMQMALQHAAGSSSVLNPHPHVGGRREVPSETEMTAGSVTQRRR